MHARSAAAQRGQLPSDCGDEGHAEPAGAGLRAAWAGLASRAAAEKSASEPTPRSSLKKGLRVKNGDAAVGYEESKGGEPEYDVDMDAAYALELDRAEHAQPPQPPAEEEWVTSTSRRRKKGGKKKG